MKHATILITWAIILGWGIACQASLPDILFVSPQGHDINEGSPERPFATIQKAVDAASQRIANANLPEGVEEPGVFISVEAGTYFLTEPIRIKTSRISLWGKDGATISGGRIITGFTQVEDGLVVADIPEVKAGNWNFRDLYVNDQRAIRARHPNTGFFRVNKAGADRRTNFTYNEGDLKNWQDLDSTGLGGVELVFLHDWSITRCPIKEINEAERRLTVPIRIGCDLDFFHIDGWEPHPRYYVENSIEFLDAPSEWFLDTEEGKLFYRLKEGETADSIEVIAPVLTQLLVVEGTNEQKIKDIGIFNIRFAHAAYFPKPENTVWETQAAAFMVPGGPGGSQFLPSPAALHFEFAQNVNIHECRFEHLGENGLWFSKGCSHCIVNRSIFRDIGANAIMIGTHNHQDTVEICAIHQNLVEKAGQTLYGAIGIWVGFGKHVDIHDNIIRELPYGGISLGWQWNPNPTPARENKIRNNLIYNCMLTLSDSGGIYTLGYQPDSIIEGNIIHGIPHAHGRAESNGMFLDEGTKGFIIRNNTVFGTEQSSLRFHKADTNVVENNILLNKPGVPMIRYNSTPERNIELINNRDF
ncbi:MAG: right-handed parallel beta-helix repeat-containing protein [Planctomycetaceae bacterium]|nr:right-handed parallel beta-helix repeat-containing protein [Planctomycetaceae bacterium]